MVKASSFVMSQIEEPLFDSGLITSYKMEVVNSTN